MTTVEPIRNKTDIKKVEKVLAGQNKIKFQSLE